MGQRGKSKTGYNLALLYALDLHYRVAFASKGHDPSAWQPKPRKRPEQFLRWIQDCLTTLDGAPPDTFADLFERLQAKGLTCIAKVVEYTVNRKCVGHVDAVSASILENQHSQANSPELHPQVRKYARTVGHNLDRTWHRALAAAWQRHAKDWPNGSFLLGGLPPGFSAISEQILGKLGALERLGGFRELTVFQLYGLATGAIPKPPSIWAQAIEQLVQLTDGEIELLRGLSDAQVNALRALDDQAATLLKWGLQNFSSVQWRAIVGAFNRLSEDDFTLVTGCIAQLERMPPKEREQYLVTRFRSLRSGNITVKFLISHAASKPKSFLRNLRHTELRTWKLVQQVDDEVGRVAARGQLTRRFRRQLDTLDFDGLHGARELLCARPVWLQGYLEDRQVLHELFAARNAVRLDLRELFPITIAFLDQHLQQHLEEALIEAVADVEADARAVEQHCLSTGLSTFVL